MSNKEEKLKPLIVPIYINEKIVLDMLAIIEEGFSMVSQVSYTQHKEGNSTQKLESALEPTTSILSKFLKINISGELSHTGSNSKDENVEKEKVHTNVSLLSKFRNYLIKEKILETEFDVKEMKIGDFIEVEGELQKNPLINCMDIFVDIHRMANIFAEKPQLGTKTQAKNQKQQEDETLRQIKSFVDELKHTGTIDFILADEKGTVVLSVQEQYLTNDNISEILGGHFKVLGKVITICKDETENIDLLRKTTLSVLPEGILNEMFSSFQMDDIKQFKLPELKTKRTCCNCYSNSNLCINIELK